MPDRDPLLDEIGEFLAAGAPPSPAGPPPGPPRGVLPYSAESPLMQTLASFPSQAGRYLMGAANLVTLPFRAGAEAVAEAEGLRPGGAGTVSAELARSFGPAPELVQERGLMGYGETLAHTLGVGEGATPAAAEEGATARAILLSPVARLLPREIQDSFVRGGLNLVGGVLEDPTAIYGLASGALRVAGKELVTRSPQVVQQLARLTDAGLAMAALPGMAEATGASFVEAKAAFDKGDMVKASQKVLEGVGFLGLGGLVVQGARAGVQEGRATPVQPTRPEAAALAPPAPARPAPAPAAAPPPAAPRVEPPVEPPRAPEATPSGAPPTARLTPEEVIAKLDEGGAEAVADVGVVDLARAVNRLHLEAETATGFGQRALTTYEAVSAFEDAIGKIPADSPLHRSSIVEQAKAHVEGLTGIGEQYARSVVRDADTDWTRAAALGIEPKVKTDYGAEVLEVPPGNRELIPGTWIRVQGPDGKTAAAIQLDADGKVANWGVPDYRTLGGGMNSLRTVLAVLDHTDGWIPNVAEQSGATRRVVRNIANLMRVEPDKLTGHTLREVVSDQAVRERLDKYRRRLIREYQRTTEPAPGAGPEAGAEVVSRATPVGAGPPGAPAPPSAAPGGVGGEVVGAGAAPVGRTGGPGGALPGPPGEGAGAAGGPAAGPAPGTVPGPALGRAEGGAGAGGAGGVVPPTAGNLALQADPNVPPPRPPGTPPGAPSPYDPATPLTEPMLRQPLHQEVTRVAGDVMNQLGIPWDRQRFPVLSDQLALHINDGTIPLATLVDVVQQNGLTLREFTSELWRPAVTDAAQRLAALSQLARRIDQVGREAGGKAGDTLREAAADLGTEVDAYAASRSWWRRLDNIRRGLLVSQVSTTMRNVSTQMVRLSVGALSDAMDYGMQKALKTAGVNLQPTHHPLDGFRILGQAFWSLASFGKGDVAARAKHLTEAALELFNPKFSDRLFQTYASDISTAARDQGVILRGADKVFSGAERAVDIINTLNRGQEFIFRRAVFSGTLDSEIRALGGESLDQVIASHNRLAEDMTNRYGADWEADARALQEFQQDPRNAHQSIQEPMIQRAVNRALENTFAETPKWGTAGHAFVNAVNKIPGLTLFLPFPRFMVNSFKFLWQWNPTGFLRLLSSEERARVAQGDTSAISRAALGTAMLFAAYQVRQSKNAGERWYEINIEAEGEKRTLDIRPFNPFAAHFFVADLLHKWKTNTLYNMSSADILQGLLSVNLRAGTGLALLDNFAKQATSVGSPDEIKKSLARVGGEYLSGFLTPLQNLADLYAQFDADARIVRDRRTDPFMGPIKSRFPGGSKELPELEVPTRAGPREYEFPLLKQLTGLLINDPQNPLELELARLQFGPNEIFRGTRSPEADALVKRYMGQISEDEVVPVVQSPEYQALSDAEKGVYLAQLLGQARKTARRIAIAERPDIFVDLKRKSIRQRILEAEELREGEEEMVGFRGGPPEAPEAPE